jgi:hypothetical protein
MSDLGVDLGLADAVEVVLDRVLDRHDVARWSLMRSSAAYSVVVLPEPVGPVTRMMPCGLVDQRRPSPAGSRLHAQAGQVEPAGLLVEQAQHHALAVAGGHRGDAHVDRAPGDAQRDAAVLRQALLGDVEARHDLDARHQQRRQRALGLQHLAQHAVDAEAHHQPVLEGLDVDVGGVLATAWVSSGVDQPDDRRVVLALQQVRARAGPGRLGKGPGRPPGPSAICMAALEPLRRPAMTSGRPVKRSSSARATPRG